ncbi:MAG: YiiX/YebB-like N1pC/P60 family cysteine hydrolase [Myxococcota bacterium]
MPALPFLLAAQLSLGGAPPEPAPLPPKGVYALPQDEFVAQARRDLATLKLYANGLRRLQAQLEEHASIFHHKPEVPLSPDEKRILLSSWGAFFSYVISAEGLRQRYWDFVKMVPLDGVRHLWGYMLTHAALTTELAHGLAFADLTAGNPQLEVLLDEPNPEFGVPAKAFADFKFRVIHVATSTQLYTGDAYRSQVLPAMQRHKLLEEPEVRWAMQEMRLNSQVARGRLKKRGPTLFIKNAVDILRDGVMSAIFPVQKGVAELMGDTRVRRVGKPLIHKEQIDTLLPKLEPGDIVVARQNWFLSNIGLPGFWPHAELYVGTPQDLAAYFDDDPEVLAYANSMRAERFTALLAKRFPEKWKRFAHGKDLQGNGPHRIIESISEGVSFTAVEHGMGVDYLGVMRPRLPKVEKAKAIVRAFGYLGRPYDFDFDFFSDSTLVCTELVYKSYVPSKDMKGLSVELVNVAGRRTLPANELVKLFDAEADRPDRQLDFVAFLEGLESQGKAVERDLHAFRKSHTRVKWDVAQR